MSTRALYTFKGHDGDADWNVYKHSDGYPSGAAETLAVAQAWFAWKLPRYESDEFACAFIAAAKSGALTIDGFHRKRMAEYGPGGEYNKYAGGGVRLMPQGNPKTVACQNCADIEYRYEISRGNGDELRIAVYAGDYWEADKATEEMILNCNLSDFASRAAQLKADAA